MSIKHKMVKVQCGMSKRCFIQNFTK